MSLWWDRILLPVASAGNNISQRYRIIMFLLSEMIIAPYWWQTAAARLIAWQQWASWEEAGFLGIFKEG